MLGIRTLQCEIIGQKVPKYLAKTVHVNDVVTDCSYALSLTEFLVSTLFGAFPGQS